MQMIMKATNPQIGVNDSSNEALTMETSSLCKFFPERSLESWQTENVPKMSWCKKNKNDIGCWFNWHFDVLMDFFRDELMENKHIPDVSGRLPVHRYQSGSPVRGKAGSLTASSPWTVICEWHGEEKVSAWPLWKSQHYKSNIISASARGLGLPWRPSGAFRWVGGLFHDAHSA